MKKCILIDGTALLYRGFFAIPPFLRTQSGELTNAVYGVSLMLLNLYIKEKPDYLAITFDRKEKTFRHEEFKDYKAHRPPPPPGLHDQLPLLKEVLEAFEMPVFEMAGFEADDILATLSTQALEHSNVHVLIATGDLDITQLVNERLHVISPQKGFNELKLYDVDGVYEKFGLMPSQVIDYKALRGDTSDNIPGVRGIGEKTATKLLQQYETLERVYEHLDEITGAVHTKLSTGKDDAFFSKKLVTLIHDVDVAFDLDACETHEIDWHRVIDVFQRFEFGSLIAKVQHTFKPEPKGQTTLF